MDYDLVIVGSGFAGLAAAKKAKELGLNFCIVAKDAGATQHFSGAFDVIDPRWQEPELAPSNYPSLRLAIDRFILGHPDHVYAKLLFEFCMILHIVFFIPNMAGISMTRASP